MEKYLNDLSLEFKKTIGNQLLNEDELHSYLIERKLLSIKYAEFLSKIGLDSQEVVELHKGYYDSVCDSLAGFGYDTLAVGEYAKTFGTKVNAKNNIIVINDGIPYINGTVVDTLVTQLPIHPNSLYTLKDLALNGTQVVLGTYGNKLDSNRDSNIKSLKLYESFLRLIDTTLVKSKYVIDDDSYMGVVISKPKEYVLNYPLRTL